MILKKLDMHVHVQLVHEYPVYNKGTGMGLTCPELRGMYDAIGVEKGVALPDISPEYSADQFSNRDARLAAEQYPETIGWWFCNVDPRWITNSPEANLSIPMTHFKSCGAKGIGELSANLPFDDPLMENLFHHAENCGLPVLFHIGRRGNDYGIVDDLGLPRLEKALQKFSKLRFIGHSQKWWSEISGDNTEVLRGTRPKTPVKVGGRAVELLRNHPNMYADLSAGSGENAILRDPAFGYQFLEEFQDKLYFGTDYCSLKNDFHLSEFLDEGVENGRMSQRAYNKICRENLLALMVD
ncbi:MAG: hypothetical protein RRZ24_06915 [Clostridia bacterium]